MSTDNKSGTGLFVASGLFMILGALGVGAYFLNSSEAEATKVLQREEVQVQEDQGGKPANSSPLTSKRASTKADLKENIHLQFADTQIEVSRESLGLTSEDGKIKVDRGLIEKALVGLKAKLDKGPSNAYLDLENRKIHAAKSGLGLDLFGSVSAVEVALRTGQSEVELEGVEIPAEIGLDNLGIADISTVIGSFKTKFSVSEKTRNDNLKLLASKLNGLVLQPGEKFSFNKITGDRLLEDGFKMAHVISQGQMVDGMAGGSCQISTTLHGAAFFSGLDILSVTPHSRPSTYAMPGLDATVVASKVDLKLANPYDFPVVIHYRVARGESVVEILGKEKPFDEIEFERNIDKRINFKTVTREDPEMAMGNMVVEQHGYPGYKVSKVRRVYKDGKVIRTDNWKLQYRPVVEYAKIGINPNPNLKPPKKRKKHGPRPVAGRFKMRR